jgi:hypothetical protein
MARKRKPPRSYFEPWVAAKSKLHGDPPNTEGVPEDAAAAMRDAWQRAEDNADWVLWGSKMADPCVVRGLVSGDAAVMDDRRIIAVRRTLGLPDGSPDHEAVARRICDCVNACQGVGDPAEFVKDVRALLLALARGELDDPREDVRVVSLLARCIPPEELEEFRHEPVDR